MQPISIEVTNGDLTEVTADAVVLKFAQGFYGAAGVIADRLWKAGIPPSSTKPKAGEHSLVETKGAIAAPLALYMGVQHLSSFGYSAIRKFAIDSLSILTSKAPQARKIAFTIHGPGYGLDERESLLSIVGGIIDAAEQSLISKAVRLIEIVEIRHDRAERLRQYLDEHYGDIRQIMATDAGPETSAKRRPRQPTALRSAGLASDEKPHVFVAMPFETKFENVFHYGIAKPVNEAGLLCERVDQASFIGQILDRITDRIDNASLVIADLSAERPNVYLEVGYAWGRSRPTLLLAQRGTKLHFDVGGHRCIFYDPDKIRELELAIEKDLKQLGLRRT